MNEQALALLEKLGVEAKDNFLSQKLNQDGDAIVVKFSALNGADFDKAYAENELAYHKAVNALIGDVFIPNIENAEVKALFEEGLKIFKAHDGVPLADASDAITLPGNVEADADGLYFIEPVLNTSAITGPVYGTYVITVVATATVPGAETEDPPIALSEAFDITVTYRKIELEDPHDFDF